MCIRDRYKGAWWKIRGKQSFRNLFKLDKLNIRKFGKNFSGKNFSEFKEQLAEELVNKIEPISKEIRKLLDDKKFLDEILLDGVEKANMIASKKIERIKEIVGF